MTKVDIRSHSRDMINFAFKKTLNNSSMDSQSSNSEKRGVRYSHKIRFDPRLPCD
jgi:hypothetical protein